MDDKDKKVSYEKGIPFWEGLDEAFFGLIFGLGILFVIGVVIFAVIKWAFQIVF